MNNRSNNDTGNMTEDEDNFSDTDNEETWAKEAVPQTTAV